MVDIPGSTGAKAIGIIPQYALSFMRPDNAPMHTLSYKSGSQFSTLHLGNQVTKGRYNTYKLKGAVRNSQVIKFVETGCTWRIVE